MEKEPFKQCSFCKKSWDSRDDFVSDPSLKLIGYQANFSELSLGLLLFNHSCKSTIAVPVFRFRSLYGGPVFAIRATGKEECLGLCLKRDALSPCPAKCECAYVREIMRVIQECPKQTQE